MDKDSIPRLTRRRFLAQAALPPLAAAGTLLAGCRGGIGQKTVLRYWNGFTGPDGRTMLRMVQHFNAANPDVQVVMQRMDWATYYNKLFVAGLGGRAPELFVLQTLSIARFARAHFVRPVDDLLTKKSDIDVQDFDTNVWQAVSAKSSGQNKSAETKTGDPSQTGDMKHYGIPLDIWPLGMYYNRKLFREAGVVDAKGDPKPPTNREEFMDALQKLTKAGQWGFVFTNLESNVYTMMQQFGGAFFTPDNSRCLLHNPQNVAALQFCIDLISKYHYAPPPENFDAWIGFRQGKIAIAFEGIYMLADLQKQQDLDFAGAPIPQIGERRAVWAGSHNLCMRADLKERELEASWRFVQFLSRNSLDWADGGQVPARRSLRATPRFAAMSVQSAFARQIPYLTYQLSIPFVFEYQTEFNLAIEAALRGHLTPDEALAAAQDKINQILQREATP